MFPVQTAIPSGGSPQGPRAFLTFACRGHWSCYPELIASGDGFRLLERPECQIVLGVPVSSGMFSAWVGVIQHSIISPQE